MSAGVYHLDDYRPFDAGDPDRCWRCGKSEGVGRVHGDGGWAWTCFDCPHPSEA